MKDFRIVKLAAFMDEMEKEAGLGKFFVKGITQLGRVGRGIGNKGIGGFWDALKAGKVYKKLPQGSSGWDMAKFFAPAAGTAGAGLAAGYGGYKALQGVMSPKSSYNR